MSGNLWQLGAIKNSIPAFYPCKWWTVVDFCTVVVTNSSWCWFFQMELIKGPIFDWTMFEVIINISSPNSCSDLFFSHVLLILTRGLLHQCSHEKIWTDPVAISKLLCVFSWSPPSQKLSHLQRYDISKQILKKVSLVYIVQIF